MRNSTAPDFDEFWRAYPLHKAKAAALRAWGKISAKEKKKAIAALPAYIEYCKRTGISFKYAQGWLNDRRWEDEEDAPLCRTSPAEQPNENDVPFGQEAMDTW